MADWMEPFARTIDAAKKYVVSRTLEGVDWNEELAYQQRRFFDWGGWLAADDDADVFAALGAGALGYLLKDVSGDTLVAAVCAAARGEAFLQPHITTKVAQAFSRPDAPPPPAAQPLVEPLYLTARGLPLLLGAAILVVA